MLSDRYRSIELVIKNHTSNNLQFVREYFNSGGWYDSGYKPYMIKPGQTWSKAVCNEAGSMTGVTGALQFNNGYYNMGFGFTNPVMGCYKNSICAGTAQAAYDSCTDAAQPKEESFGGFTLTVYQEESSIGAMTAFIYELYGQSESEGYKGGDGGKVWIQDGTGGSKFGLGKNQFQKPELNKKYRINNK